jgi:hypothetical protein
MRAAMLKRIDQLEILSHHALMIRAAQVTDKHGRFRIRDAKQLFNAEEIAQKIINPDKQTQKYGDLIVIAKRLEEFRLLKGGGAHG